MNGLHNGTEKVSNGLNSVKNGHNGYQNGGVKINNNFNKSKSMDQIVENGNGLECCSGESKYHPEPSPKVYILIPLKGNGLIYPNRLLNLKDTFSDF